MRVIPLSGVVGEDILPRDIRTALRWAGGEEVEIQISSPGGFVTPALELFNLIRSYEGATTIRLMGLAASAASYLAMAGDRVIAEPNAVFMIHNAGGLCLGDHNDLRQTADIFERFSNILAVAYAEKTGNSVSEMRALMDIESWFSAQEAHAAGFVDEVVGDARASVDSVPRAKQQFAEASARMKSSGFREDVGQIAAFLGAMPSGTSSEDRSALAAFERYLGAPSRSLEPAALAAKLAAYMRTGPSPAIKALRRAGVPEDEIAQYEREVAEAAKVEGSDGDRLSRPHFNGVSIL